MCTKWRHSRDGPWLITTDDDWAVGMVDDVVTHAAHDGTTHCAETSCTHHYHRTLLLRSNVCNHLTWLPAEHCLYLTRQLQPVHCFMSLQSKQTAQDTGQRITGIQMQVAKITSEILLFILVP